MTRNGAMYLVDCACEEDGADRCESALGPNEPLTSVLDAGEIELEMYSLSFRKRPPRRGTYVKIGDFYYPFVLVDGVLGSSYGGEGPFALSRPAHASGAKRPTAQRWQSSCMSLLCFSCSHTSCFWRCFACF